MENNIEKEKSPKKIGGILFVGFMFMGMGLGFYYGAFLVGMFIGMGLGFIVMGLTYMYYRNK